MGKPTRFEGMDASTFFATDHYRLIGENTIVRQFLKKRILHISDAPFSKPKSPTTSVIIGFVPVYALVAMALAQARPVRDAAVLVKVLCYAALGTAGSCR